MRPPADVSAPSAGSCGWSSGGGPVRGSLWADRCRLRPGSGGEDRRRRRPPGAGGTRRGRRLSEGDWPARSGTGQPTTPAGCRVVRGLVTDGTSGYASCYRYSKLSGPLSAPSRIVMYEDLSNW